LGVSKEKTAAGALAIGDYKVLDMSVKSSWSGEKIADVLSGVSQKMGRLPEYVVSDNASTIRKAVHKSGYIHIKDVGHSIALLMQHLYEKASDFQSFTKEIADVKFREVMRPCAYLLPPKQRTIAGFMNLSPGVEWAGRMLKAFPLLSAEEQAVFGFLLPYEPLIKELKETFGILNRVLKLLKEKGLSHDVVEECLKETETLQSSENARQSALGRDIEAYLREEAGKLPASQTRWHISSDVIESTSGIYKYHRSSNVLNGVTLQILQLPLRTKLKAINDPSPFNYKTGLGSVFLRNLIDWRNTHLSKNKTIERKNKICA
jgi:hypothetical protein